MANRIFFHCCAFAWLLLFAERPHIASADAPAKREENMPASSSKPSIEIHPQLRLLCDQHVMLEPRSAISKGDPKKNLREVHWRLYATSASTESVASFYRKRLKKPRWTERSEKGDITFSALGRHHVTIAPASSIDRLPHCNVRPTRDESTIVLVSDAY